MALKYFSLAILLKWQYTNFKKPEGLKLKWEYLIEISVLRGSLDRSSLSLSLALHLYPSPIMAFILNKTAVASQLRFHFQGARNDALSLSRRPFHVEPGKRELALLAEDPSLKRFKSHKPNVRRLMRVGDVLTIVVVAGCCYEIYTRAVMREEARKQANAEN
ncbi:hypothetical protein G4B88_022140 [Cannabis sativa]|uniref:Uncharacterized protein n=1 Tax=Cannabis sativa TaxID=3483 RepID=A0A7J6DLF4_CANSA|nr:hypothetical protein G4B88_022140 [Cannabis sativa]